MASSALPHHHHHHARRRVWDLTHLSTKYPWLRVDAETIEEFRSPFQWVCDGVGEHMTEIPSSGNSSEDERGGPGDTIEGRSHARYNLKKIDGRGQRSPQKRPRPDRIRRRAEAIAKREDALKLVTVMASPRTTRSEVDDSNLFTVAAVSAAKEIVLPTNVYTDFQALKEDQRKRQYAKHKAKQSERKKMKSHSILSLRLPVLHKPTHQPTTSFVSLPKQLERLHQQQLDLQQHVRQQIEQEKAKLPLTFLFERNLDQTYCKQKCVETITSIFAKLQHRMLYYAFHRWLGVRDAERTIERRETAVKNAQTKAVALFERLASDVYVGTLARAFTRWHATAHKLVETERQAAASKIQGLYRQRRARALLKDLKLASLDREYKRAIEIQRLLAFESYGTSMKWSTLKNGFNLLVLSQCAKRITFFFRRVCTKKRIARRVQRAQAAVVIQCRWRMKLAWLRRQRFQLAREIQRERERMASIHLQRRARGYVARQHAALRRMQLANAHVAARVLQHAWRRYSDHQRLQRRFDKRRQVLDEAQAQRDELERIEAARRHEASRDRIAVKIQRVMRGFLGRREAKRRRDVRDVDRAVRRVQISWRKSKGRYALHLRFLAQRERLEHRRNACALLLQCRVRMHKAKRQRDALLLERQRRRQSAVTIQRITRGRQRRLAFATQRRATVSIQTAWRGKLACKERTRRRQQKELNEQQRYEATLKLQCVARGRKARRLTRQLRSEQQQMAQLLQQSAVLIQRRARDFEARKIAMLLREAMQVVDLQQKRAYVNSVQFHVNESALLAFITQHSIANATQSEDDEERNYSHEQLQLIQWQIESARQQMLREDNAIVYLQRRYRGYVTRVQCVVQQLQRRKQLALELRMVQKLQRVGRGFLARRRVHTIRLKRRDEELLQAYIRERRWKDQERAWQDQYREEQMMLQLQRLQTIEATMRSAKHEVEIAKWQAEAAAARKQELQDQIEATRLEQSLRCQASDDKKVVDEGEETKGVWEYVIDADGNGYYYNATTGESAWEKPAEVVPPKVAKEEEKEKPKKCEMATTEETTQATPNETKTASTTEEKSPIQPSIPNGFCCKCKAVQADKECLDCLLPDLTLDVVYCNACFTLEHNLLSAASGGAKNRHDFRVLRPLQRPSVCQHSPCHTLPGSSLPQAKASYYCCECPSTTRFSCEACFPITHDTAQMSHHIPTALHFRSGSLLCIECHTVLATRSCTQCDEVFCAACFETLHTRSKSAHEFTTLEILKDDLTRETDAYCVDCEIHKSTKLCNLCGDGFCDACFAAAHAKGQKAQHTWIAWTSFATYGDWLEIKDDKTSKTVYFNIETKESTHTQPFVLRSGDERHRVQFQEREAGMKKKAIELESEILKLREELQSVTQEKDHEIERLKRPKPGGGGEIVGEGSEIPRPQKTKKKGVLGRLFGGSKEPKKKGTSGVSDVKLTPEEARRLALQQAIAPELVGIQNKLTTRERAAKEEKAKRTVGTKHFEQAMLDEFVKGGS